MLRFVSVVMLAAAASAASNFSMPNLYAKYSMTGQPGVDSFFAVPRTESEAAGLGWTKPGETLNNTLFQTSCNPDDYRICVLTDNKGSIAGYQISIPAEVDKLNITRYNFTDKGFKKLTLFGQDMYSNQIWFVPRDVLEDGGRDFNNQTGTGLYLQVADQLLEVPLHEDQMNTTKFNKQNCFVRMGQHYFYDIRQNLEQEEFFPWFTLHNDDGVLNGFGFLAFGAAGQYEKSPFPGAQNSWIENVPAMAIKMIAPDVPQWVLDYVNQYGLYSHHMYFTENPWDIKCKPSANQLAGKKY